MAQGAGRGEKRTVGQRSRKLEQAFHSTVKYALRGSPMDEFETYFPQGSVSSETLGAVYDAYVQVWVLLVVTRVYIGSLQCFWDMIAVFTSGEGVYRRRI